MYKLEGEEDMPVIDFYVIWSALRGVFILVAELLAVLGLGEWGGRVMAALLFATFFFLAGAFKKTRWMVGILLAILFILVVALAVV
jgi:quinol-cytochrome oxidoreductase complex cytochrome b subunit